MWKKYLSHINAAFEHIAAISNNTRTIADRLSFLSGFLQGRLGSASEERRLVAIDVTFRGAEAGKGLSAGVTDWLAPGATGEGEIVIQLEATSCEYRVVDSPDLIILGVTLGRDYHGTTDYRKSGSFEASIQPGTLIRFVYKRLKVGDRRG